MPQLISVTTVTPASHKLINHNHRRSIDDSVDITTVNDNLLVDQLYHEKPSKRKRYKPESKVAG